MNEQAYQELREQSWRRKLAPAEETALQQFLARHPEAREDWLTETELNQLLAHLPDAPVSSNFTARVVQAAQLETAARERVRGWNWPAWLSVGKWLPRTALTTAALSLVLALGYHQHQLKTRATLAHNIVEVSDAVTASDPEVMQDFEPIRRLSESQPKADVELLALMK